MDSVNFFLACIAIVSSFNMRAGLLLLLMAVLALSSDSAKDQTINNLISKTVDDIRESTSDSVKMTADEIRTKTQEQANKTAKDIREKSDKLTKDLSERSSSILDDVKGFISAIVNDVLSFVKMLFGDNAPGQPALPETAGAAPVIPSGNRMGQKAIMIGLLGALSYWCSVVAVSYQRRERAKLRDSTLGGDYYHVLDENFL